MTKEFWLNLPVKDIKKSRAFFEEAGFKFNPQYAGENSDCLMIGSKGVIVMLFEEPQFKGFTGAEVTDTGRSTEMLLSFDAESPGEVDEWAKKAEAAGGTVFGKPSSIQGWMYGCGFADIDGHRWNVLYMDMAKMQG
ncbi:MAG: VOC family protein [Bacteroidota bacterium]